MPDLEFLLAAMSLFFVIGGGLHFGSWRVDKAQGLTKPAPVEFRETVELSDPQLEGGLSIAAERSSDGGLSPVQSGGLSTVDEREPRGQAQETA